MNILVLNYEYPPLGGGASPVSRDISIQLQQRGHQVTVLTMGYKDLPEYEEMQGIKIYRLKCLRSKKNVCKPWEQFTYLLAVRRFMKKHMVKNNYDVCHAHFIIPTGEAAKWISEKYHIPYTITAHGSDVEGHNQKISMKVMHRLLRNSWRKIVRMSSGVVAPSQYLLDLMNKNFQWDNYIYIPNGIEWKKYYRESGSEKKEKRILIMGRLQKFKDVQIILKALANVDLGEWNVDVLGDGPYREELEKLAEDLDLTERVCFHGWIDNGTEEQMEYLRKASMYISASQFENCPMSVIEATAAGCCPILSDIPAHRQLIATDESYFEKGNVEELAGKIRKFIKIIENKAYKEIDVSHYDWDYIMPQYERVFQTACEKRLWVTIDTEMDADVHWRKTWPPQYSSVIKGIPEIFRPIWEQYDVHPVYFVSPEVLYSEECCEVLRDEIGRGAIIGAHLHPEYIEPEACWGEGIEKIKPQFPNSACPTITEYQKIENLTHLIEEKLKVKPVWYRAARFGADLDTIISLKKLGYEYDSSVTPSIDWTTKEGSDHSKAPENPYRISENNYYEKGDSPITEFPVTISGKRWGVIGKLLPDNWLFYRWLRPTHMTYLEMKKMLRSLSGRNSLVMMFHSMEIMIGKTPYVRNKWMQNYFLWRLRKILTYAKRRGYKL